MGTHDILIPTKFIMIVSHYLACFIVMGTLEENVKANFLSPKSVDT